MIVNRQICYQFFATRSDSEGLQVCPNGTGLTTVRACTVKLRPAGSLFFSSKEGSITRPTSRVIVSEGLQVCPNGTGLTTVRACTVKLRPAGSLFFSSKEGSITRPTSRVIVLVERNMKRGSG